MRDRNETLIMINVKFLNIKLVATDNSSPTTTEIFPKAAFRRVIISCLKMITHQSYYLMNIVCKILNGCQSIYQPEFIVALSSWIITSSGLDQNVFLSLTTGIEETACSYFIIDLSGTTRSNTHVQTFRMQCGNFKNELNFYKSQYKKQKNIFLFLNYIRN